MRRTLTNIMLVLPWMAALILLVRCGSLTPTTDPSLAGGSGAGNPAGTVVLAMSAKNGQSQVLEKVSSAGKQSSTVLDSIGMITVIDGGGQMITLTNVSLSNVGVRFMLDIEENPDSLLSSMRERPPYMSGDTHCIVYDGNHEFDAMKGKVDSSISALHLPIAHYSGVALDFQDFYTAPPPPPQYGQQDTQHSKIIMSGTFLYGGAPHKIIIDIPCFPELHHQYFPFGGGIFTLSDNDTTHLDLRFDADQWFSTINFAASIGNGTLSFDSTGTLNISNTVANPYIGALQSVIALEFFASGTLVVY